MIRNSQRAWLMLFAVAVATGGVACTDGRRTFAYVAAAPARSDDVGTLSAFAVDDATGQFSSVVTLSLRNPRALAVSPSGRFLYASGSELESGFPQFVAVYRIDPQTGGLARVGEFPFPVNGHPAKMAVHGGVLYLLHHAGSTGTHGGTVAYGIDDEGGALTWIGRVSSPDDPSFAAVEPRGPFLFLGGEVCQHRCDPVVRANRIQPGGALAPVGTTIVDEYLIPADGVIDPTGRFLYVVRQSGPIVTYAVDGATGALTERGSVETGPEATGAVAIDGFGRTLFVARDGELRAYAIDHGSGLPTHVSSAPADAGPVSAAVSGRFVYVSGARSHEVRAYAASAGRLAPLGTVAAGGGDVVLVDLP